MLELQEELKWLESDKSRDRVVDVRVDVGRPILTSIPCFEVRASMLLQHPQGRMTTHDAGEAHGVWIPNLNGEGRVVKSDELVSSVAPISYDAGRLMEAANELRCGDGLYWLDKSPFYSCFLVTSVWLHEELRGIGLGHRLLRDLIAPFVLQGSSLVSLYPWPAENPEVDTPQNRMDSVKKLQRYWSEFGLKPLEEGSEYYGFNTAHNWPEGTYMDAHGFDGRK